MDPNATLKRIREMVATVNDGKVPDDIAAACELLSELAEHCEALDGWLSKRGFLPRDWSDASHLVQSRKGD